MYRLLMFLIVLSLIPLSGSLKSGGLHNFTEKHGKLVRKKWSGGGFEENSCGLNDTGVAENTS